jgi:molecular chaperone DnaK (HSP70)
MSLRLRRHNTSTVGLTDPAPRVEETGQNQFLPDECEADIVIGIDFGTTFSGIAYALTANLPKKPEDKSKLVNHVNIIRGWPGNVMADKVPSLLYYKTSDSSPSWGFTAQKNADKNKDGIRIAHFKLGLQRDLSVYAPIPSDSPLGGGYINDYDWHHPNLGSKKAINFAADYLSCIFNYSKERLETHHGAARLENQKTAYVVTVPAIWGGEAKELTRRVATSAGIPRRSLILITEPEAAAVYCSSKCKQEGGLNVNDKFLICDAGGGTVVYLLVYE